jgi:hypothetical protein
MIDSQIIIPKMPKSKVRKKNGKKVKYQPKKSGISMVQLQNLNNLLNAKIEEMKEAESNENPEEKSDDLSQESNI